MAFVDTLPDTPEMPFFYNVDQGVGPDPTGFYRRDDILLVQYLLKKVWDNREKFTPPFPLPPAPGSIETDGYFGRITARWILQFQKNMRSRGRSILPDGRVDRAHGAIASISHTQYTIIHLNNGLRIAEPDTFANIIADPECPPELGAAVGVVVTPGDSDADDDS
jgi:hypothetical protein